MQTKRLTAAETAAAAQILRSGGLVGVPTETVYGLAANGLDCEAVLKIYDVKGRPETKPISLLVADIQSAETFCEDIPVDAYVLAEKFWPGPLTMVLKRSSIVPDVVAAGGKTVGIRCPDHSSTLEIIRFAGVPLAAPSANVSGQPSPKTAEDVLDYFDGRIDAVVDGGQSTVGIESTILDMTRKPYCVLRRGGLSPETIREETGIEVV